MNKIRNIQTVFGLCVQTCLYNLLGVDVSEKILPSKLENKIGITHYEEIILFREFNLMFFPILADFFGTIPDDHVNDIIDCIRENSNATYRVDVDSKKEGQHAILLIVKNNTIYIDDPIINDVFTFHGKLTIRYKIRTINLVVEKKGNGEEKNVLPPSFH